MLNRNRFLSKLIFILAKNQVTGGKIHLLTPHSRIAVLPLSTFFLFSFETNVAGVEATSSSSQPRAFASFIDIGNGIFPAGAGTAVPLNVSRRAHSFLAVSIMGRFIAVVDSDFNISIYFSNLPITFVWVKREFSTPPVHQYIPNSTNTL